MAAGGGTGGAWWDEAGGKGAGERRDREYAQEERRVVCASLRFRLTDGDSSLDLTQVLINEQTFTKLTYDLQMKGFSK